MAIILGVFGLVFSIWIGARLVSNYNSLKSDYDNLLKSNYKSNYESLSINYDSLKSDYNKLSSDYNSNKSDYEKLSANYNSLKNDCDRISAEYERSKVPHISRNLRPILGSKIKLTKT